MTSALPITLASLPSSRTRVFWVWVLVELFLLSACSMSPERPEPKAEIPRIQQAVIEKALSLEGYPYRYGGETPEGGFDCSGFVQYVFEQHGIFIPRTARAMAEQLSAPESDQPAPGDLVFFNTSGTPYSHVGLYLGKNRFIHASNHRKGVRISKMGTPYWSSRYLGARRALFIEGEDTEGADETLKPEAEDAYEAF